jgi:uncharacterized protein YuzE
MQLILETDVQEDLLYIAFSTRAQKPGAVKRTVRVNEDIVLDFDGRGALLGLDVTNASKVLRSKIDEVQLNTLIGVKEAAALAHVRPSNFVRDYANRPDFPAPVADLANGRVWLQSQVIEYLNTRTRRPRLRAS